MSFLPKSFIKSLEQVLPADECRNLINSLTEPVPTSIRLNPHYNGKILIEHQQIEYSKYGYYLKDRPAYTADPAFHAGAYYPQEANSMWIGAVFRFIRSRFYDEYTGVKVLDLCAAPGGKTTDIAASLAPCDLLVANEVISQRNAILFENVSKWGLGNTVITKADASVFGSKGPLFDVVFADVPCSGEGMFRKDSGAIDEWSLSNVTLCTQRQQRIFWDVWNCLNPGGFMVYSTCTFNRSENEDNILLFCKETGAALIKFEHSAKSQLYEIEEDIYRCLPHLSKGEGLFFAILQKPKTDASLTPISETATRKKSKHPLKTKSPALPVFNGFQTFVKGDDCFILRDTVDVSQSWLSQLPGLVHPGTPVGAFFNDKWKPHAAIGLLKNANFGLPVIELNDEDVMLYLKRGFVPLKPEKLGAAIVSWNGHLMGTVNSVKNGLNNLLPMEWRIRSEFLTHSIVE